MHRAAGSKPGWSGYPQRPPGHAAHGPNRQFRLFKFFEDDLASLEVQFAGLGKAQAPAAAIEQAGSQMLLEKIQVLAGHRGGKVQPLGSSHKTSRLDDLPEHFHAEQSVPTRHGLPRLRLLIALVERNDTHRSVM